MEISVKRMLRTRGALVAAITALAVGLVLLAARALMLVIAFDTFAGFWAIALTSILPFTVGYFLGLWVVAPITEELRIGHVITRAILATGIGATLWFAVLGIVGVYIALTTMPVVLDISAAPYVVSTPLGVALQNALAGFITLLPLGVLGGVLLWQWRTANPAEHHIEGLIDV